MKNVSLVTLLVSKMGNESDFINCLKFVCSSFFITSFGQLTNYMDKKIIASFYGQCPNAQITAESQWRASPLLTIKFLGDPGTPLIDLGGKES